MRASTTLCLCLLLVLFFTSTPAQNLNWFSFDADFIKAQYAPDSAIGKIKARHFDRAKSVHSVECGGNDGEIHIGILLKDVDLPDSQSPISAPFGKESEWGIVTELPNAKLAKGVAALDRLQNKPITFEGYFRVWDEGHSVGKVHPSNPHHVFEVHPAWGFSGEGGVRFSRPDLVNSIAGFAGYGRSKFSIVLKEISDGTSPRVFQNNGRLHLGIMKAENFYQLPVKIKRIKAVTGGHELTMDVFSSNTFATLLYKDLAGITVTGSPTDKKFKVGDKTFILGFFSVNLRKALNISSGAGAAAEARSARNAVEFFVFGPALRSAVKTCSRMEEDL